MNYSRTISESKSLAPGMKYFFLSNAMLFGSFSANFIGWWVVEKISSLIIPKYELFPSLCAVTITFLLSASMFAALSTLWYEKPFRKTLGLYYKGENPDRKLLEKARKRLLNEPFFMIGITVCIWFSAAVVFSYAVKSTDAVRFLAPGVILRCSVMGLITLTLTFFWTEHIIQHRLAGVFFPNGGLYATEGTFPTPISSRLIALSFAGSIIPLLAIHLTIHGSTRVIAAGIISPTDALDKLQTMVLFETLAFIFTSSVLTMFVCMNFTRPMKQIINALKNISRGDVNQKVQVISNDEIGYTGDIINKMTEGLKERNLMRHSLNLAMEVQQNLLPKSHPSIPGLDIAGKSLYCDETGGDYFDYLNVGAGDQSAIGVVIGDVSGHGVSSALLMSSLRASLRLRTRLSDDLGEIISDVNRELARDIDDSGQFVTLFYMNIHSVERTIDWVRAGHEPAIIYNPGTDSFSELKGHGVALGFDSGFEFEVYKTPAIEKGCLLVLATDGLWETRNSENEMFGKKRVFEIIRKNANASSKEIIARTLSALSIFQGKFSREDDVTMVVVKFDG